MLRFAHIRLLCAASHAVAHTCFADEEEDGQSDDLSSALAAASDFIIEVHKGLPAELEADARRTRAAASVVMSMVGETIIAVEQQLEGALGMAYTNCTTRVHKVLDSCDPPQPPHDQPR